MLPSSRMRQMPLRGASVTRCTSSVVYLITIWPQLAMFSSLAQRRLSAFTLISYGTFIPSSGHQANNGRVNDLYLQDPPGHFVRQHPVALGMPEIRWSLALGTGDLNRDGYTDLYVANDFGPDDLYLNEGGKRWQNVKGTLFGSVGRDTYKGMNASVADLDRNGWLDVYVSNVHHALQAEGSLLWLFGPGTDNFHPRIEDRATQQGALNEQRFGWGASLSDLDLDGWVDITQANGMVDDSADGRERLPANGEARPNDRIDLERVLNSIGDLGSEFGGEKFQKTLVDQFGRQRRERGDTILSRPIGVDQGSPRNSDLRILMEGILKFTQCAGFQDRIAIE